ncbi:hypothetical protein BTB1458_3029 [Mycobacterium tuberculosis]|nr:hypothetical protein MTBK_28930 [Mycobacterium tuberculosis K]AOZ44026.1 hypothetical protein BTB1458_3029 [Mycobacterium tuberculosis]EQM21251.1 hypothetical protein FJ05194_1749 [Mycobacterium tuberculosis FJ05194]
MSAQNRQLTLKTVHGDRIAAEAMHLRFRPHFASLLARRAE